MIKPGTLCIIVGTKNDALLGRVVTTIGPLKEMAWVGVDTGGVGRGLAYTVSFPDPQPVHPYRSDIKHWCVEPAHLRPLNDPDSAPADPAYTKRKEHA